MDGNTEFKDKLIQLALPRLIIDLFDRGVDVALIKCFGQHINNQDELDHMLKIDENGENNTSDEELKIMVQRIIKSCTRVLEVLELAKNELIDIKQYYSNVLE